MYPCFSSSLALVWMGIEYQIFRPQSIDIMCKIWTFAPSNKLFFEFCNWNQNFFSLFYGRTDKKSHFCELCVHIIAVYGHMTIWFQAYSFSLHPAYFWSLSIFSLQNALFCLIFSGFIKFFGFISASPRRPAFHSPIFGYSFRKIIEKDKRFCEICLTTGRFTGKITSV